MPTPSLRSRELVQSPAGALYIVVAEDDGRYSIHEARPMLLTMTDRKWQAVKAIEEGVLD